MSDILLSMEVDPQKAKPRARGRRRQPDHPEMPQDELERLIRTLEEEMHEAARGLRFEYAARIRDEVRDLRRELEGMRRAGVR